MRPRAYRLSFLLPDGAEAPYALPRDLEGVDLTFHAAGLVAISGPSRDAVLDAAAIVLRHACRFLGPVSIAAQLMTPEKGFCGRDSWTATVGAQVSFSPTGLPPYVPAPAEARGPPELVTIEGGRG